MVVVILLHNECSRALYSGMAASRWMCSPSFSSVLFCDGLLLRLLLLLKHRAVSQEKI
jgi:hypothetical protein